MITHMIHERKFGYFMLLSNLNVIGRFNNGKVMRYSKISGHLDESNERKILACVYNKHFLSMIE
jgi:hypothetical protein